MTVEEESSEDEFEKSLSTSPKRVGTPNSMLAN